MKNLYLIIGRSGSGKTTVVEYLEKKYNYKSVASYTTRPPRYLNESGHTFISKEVFDTKKMLAYTLFNSYEYGVDQELLNNSDLYVIDINGVKVLQERYKDRKLVTINIKCNRDNLIKNMINRSDSYDAIKARLENDDKMFKEESRFNFNYVVENNSTIESLAETINKIILDEER